MEETLAPFLIVGLGNPGREYRNNRHNVGFMVVDRLAETLGVKFSRWNRKPWSPKPSARDGASCSPSPRPI